MCLAGGQVPGGGGRGGAKEGAQGGLQVCWWFLRAQAHTAMRMYGLKW